MHSVPVSQCAEMIHSNLVSRRTWSF